MKRQADPSLPRTSAASPPSIIELPRMTSANDLDIVGVSKTFGAHHAVRDVSFSVAPGEFFSILGPSGCGKTTLMRMIAGFEEPTSGDVRIRDASMLGVPANRRPVNMVFQSLALFPMMSVGENVAYGLTCRGVSRAEADERAGRMLDRVGLRGFGDRRVTALSGGQRQRVAIARCLVLDPTLVLLDEPLGALDLKLREHMKIELKQLQVTFNTTFVYITHDQSEALVMSDRIAVMNHGEFEQVGTPRDLYHHPETPFVAAFVGETNLWHGEGTTNGGMVMLKLQTGAYVTGVGTAGSGANAQGFVRPEAVVLSLDGTGLSDVTNRFQGTVSAILFDGAASSLLIDSPALDKPARAVLPQTGPLSGINVGAPLQFGWSAEAMTVFPT
jgi:spermidine/putrescine transport system ATP-binding protein